MYNVLRKQQVRYLPLFMHTFCKLWQWCVRILRRGMEWSIAYKISQKSLCGSTSVCTVGARASCLISCTLKVITILCAYVGEKLHVQAVYTTTMVFFCVSKLPPKEAGEVMHACTASIHYCHLCRVLTCSGCELCCSLAGLPCLRAPALEIEHNHSII